MKKQIRRLFLLFLAIMPIAAISFAAKTALARDPIPVVDILTPDIVQESEIGGGSMSIDK